MFNEISQSQKAIQRVVFKIFERWGEKEEKLSFLLSLIKSPEQSSREEKQLVHSLIGLKKNSEDFDSKLIAVSNTFEKYIEQKKEMLALLNKGKVLQANEIKNLLIKQYNTIEDEINSSYNTTYSSAMVQAKGKIDDLIYSKEFKLAQDFLDSSEYLFPQRDSLKKKIAYLSINYEKQQVFLELLEKNLFDELASDKMVNLWAELNLPSKDMQDLLESISAKVLELIDKKSLNTADNIIKNILTNLHPFPESLHMQLLTRKEKVFNRMIDEIQKLIDSKKFTEASDCLARFELSEYEFKKLANKILQSTHAEEIKEEIFYKINQGSFFDIYPLIKKTMFSTEDSKNINEKLTNALKDKLGVNNIDSDQAMALICDEQFQLISARAGSGKTTTLINKVRLLKSLDRINLSEYLFLVFNDAVREDISEEIKETFDMNIDEVKSSNVHTFHSFSRKIIENSRPKFNSIQNKSQENFYSKCFQNSLKNTIFNSKYKYYLSTIVHPQGKDLDKFDRSNFDSDQDYFDARNSARLLTLNNVPVKSLGEKLIGDFFFEHELIYTYEPTILTNNKIYRPDFYINFLTTHENKKIYIELWGIYKNSSFNHQSAPFDESKYKEERLKKLKYWEDNSARYHLMEIFMDDVYGNNVDPSKDFISFKENFYKVLNSKLEKITGQKFNRLSTEQVMEKVSNKFESRVLSSLEDYMRNVKSNQIDNDELNLKINKYENVLSGRAKAFLDLGYEFRVAIQKEKKHENALEFGDWVELACNEIKNGTNIELIKDKKYLFVDEFQDTNIGFMRIIKAITRANPELNIVCVGDDWQSINSFMGARTSIYHSLEEYFPRLERNKILTNYRSGSTLVDYGNKVMTGLGDPAKPFLNLGSVNYLDVFSVKNSNDFSLYIDSVKNKYDDGFKLQRYHKLLFTLIKFEINKYITDHSNKSIYGIPKSDDALILILSRTKQINGESVESQLLPIVINSLTRYFSELGYKEGSHEISTKLNQVISYKTIHAIKGGQADTVFLLEANNNKMPLRHPDRELSAIFCDDPRAADAEADAEERRMYYVAVTRAKKSLYVVTSESEKSQFMSDKGFAQLEEFSVNQTTEYQ